MRITRLTLCLLTLLGTFGGCSQIGGVRTADSSNMRTVASVGDKPLPIVAGEPGGPSVRAETEELDLPASSGARISGRVYDERGKPVPSAKVRLAVGSSPGGKIVYATTDRSGAFTLHGLRSGSSYTVIAEYQGEDGIVTGRAQAKAPQGDVRISLQSRGGESEQSHASIQPARPRVEPISNVDPVDDEPANEARSSGRYNNEDLAPPADDAASLPARGNLRVSRAGTESSTTPIRGGWNARQPAPAKTADAKAAAPESSEDTPAPSRSPARDDSAADLDDDGPNPLPPALDPGATGAAQSALQPQDAPIRVARNGNTRTAGSARATSAGRRQRDDSKAIGIMGPPGEQEPRSMPEDVLPGGRVIAPGSYGPIVVNESTENKTRNGSPPKAARGSASSRTSRAPQPANDADEPAPNDRPDLSGATDSPRRPTWRELSRASSDVPVDESIRRASGDAAPNDRGVVTLTSAKPEKKTGLARLFGGSRQSVNAADKQAVCRFDAGQRRLVDLQLPGLNDKMVTLHDFDADLILFDFWGSWCAPCRTSIPHLAELQAKMGAKRLQVVGIACERGSSLAERQASAAKAAKELGITYPVLLSTRDGSCPVQQALQIQFYPTMVLIERDGKLLAREQGATETTLARMDRAITVALGSQDKSRVE
jgi:thiol-disulfide isomerase/thioredoxin